MMIRKRSFNNCYKSDKWTNEGQMSAICLSGVGQTNDKSYKIVICPVSGCPKASVLCKF